MLLNLIVMTNYTKEWGYSGIEQLATAFDIEAQDFSLMLMLFSLSIDTIFLYFVSVKVSAVFRLADYIISRSSWHRFLKLAVKEIYKTSFVIVGLKCLADLIFVSSANYAKILYLAFLYTATFIIWGLLFVIIVIYKKSTSIAFFITMSSTLLLKVLSHKVTFASIFVVAAPDYLKDYLLLIFGKITGIILLLSLLFWRNGQDLYSSRKIRPKLQ